MKLKAFAGKVGQSVKIYRNQNLVIRTILENGFGAALSSKMNVLSVWKKHFLVFCKFLSDEVETIFRESEAKLSKLFKSKFGHRKFVRKWFWSYLELKNEYVLSVWKKHFLVFCKFLSDEGETIFTESEAKLWKLYKLKFVNRKLLRKWFWSDLELINEFSEHLKKTFLSFLQIFEWPSWNHFLVRWGKVLEST